MLQYANTSTTSGASVTIGPGPALVSGAVPGYFMFTPTAMDLTPASGSNDVSREAVRNSTTCFMRGFSEHLRIQTSSGIPWFWRRICFTSRTPDFFRFRSTDAPTQTNSGNTSFVETTNGMERLWFNQQINGTVSDTQNAWLEILFKGTNGKDWSDSLTAPVDTRRVDLKYDKMRCIRSGNAAGTVKELKLWHTMNKNIVYDDDESGDAEISSYTSVTDKAGMGNYHIFDIIVAGTGATTSDLIQITGTSALYWHER